MRIALSKSTSILGVVCVLMGFGLGAFFVKRVIARPCEQAFIASSIVHTDTLLSALKRMRQERTGDAIVVLEQALEVNEIVLRDRPEAGGIAADITKILQRLEEYRNSTRNTNQSRDGI